MRNRIRLLAAAAVLAAAACSDSNGPGNARSVAVFVNSNFVYYDTTDFFAPASQAVFTFEGLGAAVTPFAAYDSTTVAGLVAANRALYIPLWDNFRIDDSLSAGTLGLIRNFVDSSGGLLIVPGDAVGMALIDSLWNHTLAVGNEQDYYQLGADASGTAFAGAPALVWDNENMYPTSATSYPGTAQVIYALGDDVVLAVIPEGRGAVVVLGWDLEAAAPHGPQDGGWIEVLRRMIRM